MPLQIGDYERDRDKLNLWLRDVELRVTRLDRLQDRLARIVWTGEFPFESWSPKEPEKSLQTLGEDSKRWDTFFRNADAKKIKIGSAPQIIEHFSVTAALNFGVVAASSFEDKTVTVTGALDGDVVALGVPNEVASTSKLSFTGFVSATDVVTVRCTNVSTSASPDPPDATFRVDVWQYALATGESPTSHFNFFGPDAQGILSNESAYRRDQHGEGPLYKAEQGYFLQ